MAQTEEVTDAPHEPTGELSIRTLAMPADTNQNGEIFGGWVLGQMDVAGGIFASQAGLRRRRGVRLCRPDSDRYNLHHGAGSRPGSSGATRPTASW